MDINGISIASLYQPQLVEERFPRKPVVIDVKPIFETETNKPQANAQVVIPSSQVDASLQDAQQAQFVRLFASSNANTERSNLLPVISSNSQQQLPETIQQYIINTQTYSDSERLFDEMV